MAKLGFPYEHLLNHQNGHGIYENHDASPYIQMLGVKYDPKRMFMHNVPSDVDQEFLELYIDYLTNEVEIEKILRSQINEKTLMILFKTQYGT